MTQYRRKPVVIEATQWFKNGDHPVVRYSRRPDVRGDLLCRECGNAMHVHGLINMLVCGLIVCPGDWIITGVKGETYPCKPDIFAATYEVA